MPSDLGGSDVGPLGGTVAVRFVHGLEVDQAVVAVLIGHGIPHGVPSVHIVNLTPRCRAIFPVTEDRFETAVSGGINHAGVDITLSRADGMCVDW